MQEYTFSSAVNQVIVDGILNGYKSYIHERNEKQRTMKISDAYAWVKGNHIDDQTARECASVGIEYKKAKAGYTWGYLQFSSSEDKSMFIIKNAKYFNEGNFPGGKGIDGNKKRKKNDENYLKKLSRVNHKIKFPETRSLPKESGFVEFLTLFDDNTLKSLEDTEVSKLQKAYDKFYIVTYEIDEAFMISKIFLWMPNPHNEKAYLVDDLTGLINNSSVDFEDVDTTVLENDEMDSNYESPAAFDYDIYHDEELDDEKADDDSQS
ncbi:hypothetical protein RW25_04120 [Bacillus sp. L_1B0_8]|uniref:spr1630 family ClpXP-sensitive toxin n=1 Tax=unclassified Bacillus (in: firmicutes) TaxID=185979 RepID=UPI0005B727F1|nr:MULTISPECIES: hypothetical protein [unclassified Bacillus (in: firmicutes)]KIQ82245.1 hypothetical protein RT27_24245 [Bacillus sp. L_1B0_5]KIQ92162.1 hypothetical protein RW25_04120 [Bacillus sp. L_1B0_8]